jgi:hypothetical protein
MMTYIINTVPHQSPRRRPLHAPPSPAAVAASASPAPAIALSDARRPSRLASSPRHDGGSPERSCGGLASSPRHDGGSPERSYGGAGRKEEEPHEQSCGDGVSGEKEEGAESHRGPIQLGFSPRSLFIWTW